MAKFLNRCINHKWFRVREYRDVGYFQCMHCSKREHSVKSKTVPLWSVDASWLAGGEFTDKKSRD